MPIYEYECKGCGVEFARLVGMSAENPKCFDCGAETRKAVSLPSFVLKGGGWERDGYQKPRGSE